jgi:hypothetical protein
MTDEVDLVEADLEGLFVGVTGLTLARLIAMNVFDGIGSMNHCVTGMLIHSVSSFRCGAKCAVSESMFCPVYVPPASREQFWVDGDVLRDGFGGLPVTLLTPSVPPKPDAGFQVSLPV